jgi:hypothetical protein
VTYPQTAGFQSHSDTSREAAEKLDASTLRGKIFERIAIMGAGGLTIDDVSIIFDIVPGTASARIRELEMSDKIIKTKQKRQTRHRRQAYLYVTPEHFSEHMGRATVKKAPDCDIIRLEAEHRRMKEALVKIILISGAMGEPRSEIAKEAQEALPHSA